ncbi:MAG: hypothetical protein CVU09_05355 [Bacteroidetes bacterium HGW-Bacteroidetes-4]|jgi:hypothetical protein|nr:MAG: hypothetical protein CVU09_05355 [Bacteroidetes bacterium HGW-Bacteroidetes-4]
MIKKLLPVLLLTLFIWGCSHPLKNSIADFELQQRDFRVTRISFCSEIEPFYACDSLKILQDEYQKFYDDKMIALQNSHEELAYKIFQADSVYRCIDNESMKKVFKLQMDAMTVRLDNLNAIRALYQKQPELTQCNYWLEKIAYYSQNDSLLLAYKQCVEVEGYQGTLPRQTIKHYYLFDTTKTQLLDEIRNP